MNRFSSVTFAVSVYLNNKVEREELMTFWILHTSLNTKGEAHVFIFVSFIFCFATKKQSQQYFSYDPIKKTTTVKYKMKYTKTTQCYPEKIGNSIKWNVLKSTTTKKVRKGYLKRRQVSTTKCATLPQSVCTSFLGYKVMQILYNKLTQAHLPTTTAKTK